MYFYFLIWELWGGYLSALVFATELEGMIKEGEELAALHPNIVVKVPCIEAGIKAIKYFTRKGIRTNCTLVFSVGQALLAAKAGATYVSPFVGRLDDIASDGIELVRKIVEMYDYYDYDNAFLKAYGAASKTEEDFKAFLDEWVYGLKSHEEYLDKVGASRLTKLKVTPGFGYAADVSKED